jgi:hypothetical protein
LDFLPDVHVLRVSAVLFLIAMPAAAQDWVAGVDTNGDATFTYVTHYSRRPLTRSTSLLYWQSASYLSYRVNESGGTTRVNSPGVSTGVSYGWTNRKSRASIGGGYEIRWTERNAPSGITRETEQGPVVEGDVATRLAARTAGRVAGRYSFANKWRAASADLRQQIAPRLYAGPQVIWQGNRDLSVLSAGAFIEIPFGTSALQLRAGQARTKSPNGPAETKPYVSAGIVVAFPQ